MGGWKDGGSRGVQEEEDRQKRPAATRHRPTAPHCTSSIPGRRDEVPFFSI